MIVIIQFARQMHNYTEKYNDDPMPELVPLERKNTSPSKNKKDLEQPFRSKAEENKIQSEVQSPAARENSVIKVPELDRVASKKMDQNIKRRQNQLKKRNQISKNLISQMINKISLKSITEQNYPVSNETIERLLMDLDEEIHVLTLQANKFQNSLQLNPTNQHIKKELQAIEKSLNQIKTIRELYQEKIDNRGKISELQAKIMNLKAENRELKIKIARGIQKIESHIHNLPCQKEKQLIEEVNKYKQALSRQKDMRENLQSNISTIVLNFKRFYVEADEARKIVTEQLKNINQKEQLLNTKLDNLNLHKFQQKNVSQELKSIRLDSNANSSQAFFRERRFTNRLTDEENMAEIINQINIKQKDKEKQTKLDRIEQTKRTKQKINLSQLGSAILNRELSDTSRNPFYLEQQIEKMRTNQHNFRRIAQRK